MNWKCLFNNRYAIQLGEMIDLWFILASYMYETTGTWIRKYERKSGINRAICCPFSEFIDSNHFSIIFISIMFCHQWKMIYPLDIALHRCHFEQRAFIIIWNVSPTFTMNGAIDERKYGNEFHIDNFTSFTLLKSMCIMNGWIFSCVFVQWPELAC